MKPHTNFSKVGTLKGLVNDTRLIKHLIIDSIFTFSDVRGCVWPRKYYFQDIIIAPHIVIKVFYMCIVQNKDGQQDWNLGHAKSDLRFISMERNC